MSRPTFSLPKANAPTPPNPLLLQFPTPWVVGAYGDIWVAADVTPAPSEPSGWRATSPTPRLVLECSLWPLPNGLAELIVERVNAGASVKPPY